MNYNNDLYVVKTAVSDRVRGINTQKPTPTIEKKRDIPMQERANLVYIPAVLSFITVNACEWLRILMYDSDGDFLKISRKMGESCRLYRNWWNNSIPSDLREQFKPIMKEVKEHIKRDMDVLDYTINGQILKVAPDTKYRNIISYAYVVRVMADITMAYDKRSHYLLQHHIGVGGREYRPDASIYEIRQYCDRLCYDLLKDSDGKTKFSLDEGLITMSVKVITNKISNYNIIINEAN